MSAASFTLKNQRWKAKMNEARHWTNDTILIFRIISNPDSDPDPSPEPYSNWDRALNKNTCTAKVNLCMKHCWTLACSSWLQSHKGENVTSSFLLPWLQCQYNRCKFQSSQGEEQDVLQFMGSLWLSGQNRYHTEHSNLLACLVPTCLPVCLPDCLIASLPCYLPSFLHNCLLACLASCLPACLPACLPSCMPSCLHVCSPGHMPVCFPTCLSSCLPACLHTCMHAWMSGSVPAC